MMISDGILNINKPQNMTSHDVVSAVRRITGIKRVGHTGTLDPMASGVLPVCIGRSTRIMEYLDADMKVYRCSMLLGVETDTQDIWGTELRRSPVKVSEEEVRDALSRFSGLITQTPPMYSALKVNGKKLYRKDKERYVVNPLGLVYSGEYFYLVCFHDKYGDPANYRIDKMEDVCEEKQSITKKKEYDNFDLNAYRKESFSMFSGEKVEVTLFFPRDLIYVAKERFGDIIPVSVDNGYIIHTTVRVSKTFFSWLSTFEGQVKIIDPKLTQQQFKEFITGILAKIE